MRPILLVLLLASPCAASDWGFLRGEQLAAAPAPTVSSSSCACGANCPCADEWREKYATYKLYHDRMEAWLKQTGQRTVATTTSVVSTTTPVVSETVTYAEEPVYLPTQSYTGGYYTRWMGNSYSTGRRGLFTGKRIRGGYGGACIGGNCQ
jgi:hypothetical protein